MPALLLLASLILLLLGAVFWRTQSSEAPKLDPQHGQGTLLLGLEAPPEGNTQAPPVGKLPPMASEAAEPPQAKELQLEEPSPGSVAYKATPAAEDTPLSYTVQAGDSLYRIVRKVYGTADDSLIQKIAAANQMADAGSLAIGQKLSLPLLEGYPAPQRPE